jgi:hypothetical protein
MRRVKIRLKGRFTLQDNLRFLASRHLHVIISSDIIVVLILNCVR